MLDMISFWAVYGALMVMFWGFYVYWGMYFVDKYISSITGGDYNNYLCDKFRNPLMMKLGLMGKGGVCAYNTNEYDLGPFQNHIFMFIMIIFSFANLLITFIDLNEHGELLLFSFENTLHDMTVSISEGLTEHLGPYIMVVTLFLLGHNLLKKLYSFGKKVNKVLEKDTIDNE